MSEADKDKVEGEKEGGKVVVSIPTVHYYQTTYALSMSDNDQKATRLFKQYESQEKLRRLQNELNWIREGKVAEAVLKQVVGLKRRARYKSWENWASLMLQWLLVKKT